MDGQDLQERLQAPVLTGMGRGTARNMENRGHHCPCLFPVLLRWRAVYCWAPDSSWATMDASPRVMTVSEVLPMTTS